MKGLRILAMLTALLCLVSLTACHKKGKEDTTTVPDSSIYTVSFKTGGGDEPESVRVTAGSPVPEPIPPVKDGYVFKAWLHGTSEWHFSLDKVTSDITLTAQWISLGSLFESIEKTDETGYLYTYKTSSLITLRLPDRTAKGTPIVGIADGAFAGADQNVDADNVPYLKYVMLGKGITHVGAEAFAGCSAEIRAEGELLMLGEGAFAGCTGLGEIRLAEGMTAIPPEAFAGCTGLEEIAIPCSVQTIEENAFEGCSSLKTVFLGSAVSTVKDSAFVDCEALEEVYYYGADQAAFDAIEIAEGNNGNTALLQAALYFYAEEAPAVDDNRHWYVNEDGRVRIW